MMLTQVDLASIKQRAMRKRVWFRVLSRAERTIVSLTIRCVERIRSPVLARIVTAIVHKLTDALKGVVERLMETVGRLLAEKLSRVARAWGNLSAGGWAEDPGLVQYLTIMHMNTPRVFQT